MHKKAATTSPMASPALTADMGATQQPGDVDLASDTFLSRFTDTIPLTEQALALPGMRGSGQVRDMGRIYIYFNGEIGMG